MRIPIMLRVVLVALIALISVDLQSAHADTGGITLVVYKGVDHRRVGRPRHAQEYRCHLIRTYLRD